MGFPTIDNMLKISRTVNYDPNIRSFLEAKEDGVSVITTGPGGGNREYGTIGKPFSNVPARPSPGRNPKRRPLINPNPPPYRILPQPPGLHPIYSVENI